VPVKFRDDLIVC